MRTFVRLSLAMLAVVLVPRLVAAQASITGTVKDSSGAVLPGVLVEASSPALIEKVRSASTNASGQYRIEDLRPGNYDVTFSLSGFSSIKREGIELTGSFAATVSVELRVGAVSETITVSGQTPVVDVVNAKQQTTVTKEMMRHRRRAVSRGRRRASRYWLAGCPRGRPGHYGDLCDARGPVTKAGQDGRRRR